MKFLPSMTGTMSGSMGGCTASHNRGGMYFRNRVVPTNPNTTLQAAVRGYFTSAVNAWTATLTQGERDAWTTFAANTPGTDSLGSSLVLTGQQAFIKMFCARARAGLAPVIAAPVIFDNGQPVVGIMDDQSAPNQIALLSGSLEFSVNLMDTTPAAGDVLVYLGRPQNASVNFYKGPYQFFTVAAIAGGVSTLAISEAVTSGPVSPEPAVGQWRPVRTLIVYDDGRVSADYKEIVEIVAGTP